MYVSIAQMNPTPGDLDKNLTAMLEAVQVAQNQGAEFLIFSVHCLTGASLEGLSLNASFLDDAAQHLFEFADKAEIPCIVSCLTEAEIEDMENTISASALFLVQQGNCELVCVPMLEEENACPILDVEDTKFAFLLGECFAQDCELGDVDVFVEIEGDVFEDETSLPAASNNLKRLRSICQTSHANLIYLNLVGVNDSRVFPGGSVVMDSYGEVLHAASICKPEVYTFDTQANGANTPLSPQQYLKDYEFCCWELLKLSIHDYVKKNSFTDVLVGLSGGIDSAFVATLAVDALDAQHVHALFLPGPYTSSQSFEDACAVADNLGIDIKVISIVDAFNATMDSLEKACGKKPDGVAPENLQARIRANFLMAISNMNSYLLLNTGNKSEAAMGFTTLYGDSVGAYAPIGDLYKTEIYELAKYRNSQSYVIPKRIIEKEPSSELYEGAKDSDRLPDYDELDSILTLYIDSNAAVSDIVEEGFDVQTVHCVVDSVKKNEFKRRQEPISPHLDGESLTNDRDWPITNAWVERL